MRPSGQAFVGANRKPRVHITYDLQVSGKLEKKELAYVVGVMADLLGETPATPLADRRFYEVTEKNFDDLMGLLKPSLNLMVPHKVDPNQKDLACALKFSSMKDFTPGGVATQVPELKKLLEVRQALVDLVAKVGSNGRLHDALLAVLKDSAKAKSLADAA